MNPPDSVNYIDDVLDRSLEWTEVACYGRPSHHLSKASDGGLVLCAKRLRPQADGGVTSP